MNILELSQEGWLMIHAVIFIVTAFVIWRQLRIVSRASSIESFYKINVELRAMEIREVRRKLYIKGSELEISDIQEKYNKNQKPQLETRNSKRQGNMTENEKIVKMVKFVEEDKQFANKVHDLIMIFETMGVIVDKGGVIKEIMIDMYWDVIIKSWDCLFPIVYMERNRKSEYVKKHRTKDPYEYPLKYFLRWIEFFWFKEIRQREDPSTYGFGFKLLDFCPASSYLESHYENFERLTRNAEWYAWKRGISRPMLYEPGN